MPKDRDYDYVVGKLPRKDKSGKDALSDKIGKGGRHRKNGTFSGMAYDLQIVDSDPRKPMPVPPPRVITRTEYVDRTPSLEEELVKMLASKVVDFSFNIIGEGIRYLCNNHREKKEKARHQKILDQSRQTADHAKAITQPSPTRSSYVIQEQSPVVLPADFDGAYHNYTANITSEQAQKKLFDAFVFQYLCMKNLNELSRATIIDTAGNIIDGKTVVAKLSDPEVVRSINSLLGSNPVLLDEWQAKALSDALGRELVQDARFVPIQRRELIMSFMQQEQ